MIILQFSYILNMILYTIILKSISYYYDILNIIFSCLLFGIYFPILFIYFIYNNLIVQKLDIICGILDYIQLIFFYIGINNINIAEYLSYRTLSIIFNILLSIFFMNKVLNYIEIVGLLLIISMCLLLIILGELLLHSSNLFYIVCILLASLVYSIMGFLIEIYPNKSNFIQTKTISSFLNIFTYMIFGLYDDSINLLIYKNSSLLFWTMTCFMGGSEIIYYYLKIKIINKTNDGSIFMNFLDILRRVITLIIGIILFNDTYSIYYFICFFFICIGCIIIQFNKEILLYNKTQSDEIAIPKVVVEFEVLDI